MSWIPRCVAAIAKKKTLIRCAEPGERTSAEAVAAAAAAAADPATVSFLLQDAAAGNVAGTHAFVVCSTALRAHAADLIAAFPAANHSSVLHGFAAKANPLHAVLAVAADAGLGCEAASIGELLAAERAFAPHRIVYDSPVKTLEELAYVCYRPGGGIFLNVDNFDELDRVAALHAARPITATVGLRINPQVGAGSIGQLSTGNATSKFGIGLQDRRADIIAAFSDPRYSEFLRMLHVHTGSQGIGLDMMVAGVRAITDLAEEIGGGKVAYIDIGGGLPVNFASDEFTPTFGDYAARLREGVPALFAPGRYGLITEFGRALVAKAGILVSRVEFAKENGGRRIVQQHVGADLAVRTVWQPEKWVLRVDLYNGVTGELLDAADAKNDPGATDVAGPCCLGGDLLAANRTLPRATALRDLVVAKDVGGYYHSGYSFYNLRALPPCALYDDATGELTVVNRGLSVGATLGIFH